MTLTSYHWQANRHKGNWSGEEHLRVVTRLLSSIVDPVTGCWEWQGAITLGYGRIRFAGRVDMAHRVSHRLFVGPIPRGLQIDHLCRNRACVNPAHLEAVTADENVRRGVVARRIGVAA